jgi:hypothetical protein
MQRPARCWKTPSRVRTPTDFGAVNAILRVLQNKDSRRIRPEPAGSKSANLH